MRPNAQEPGAQTRLGDDFRWPNGSRICVIFNVAFEGWSDGVAPGIGPMGNPLKAGVLDTNAISWAEYGPRRGIYRLLDVLSTFGVKASVMINGILAERFPEAVAAIVEGGHEAVAHSYAMDKIPIYMDEGTERENIARTTSVIERAAGSRPIGWISPRGTPSAITSRLLAEMEYIWHGDCFDDDIPYVENIGMKQIVAIPLTMELNDLPFYMRYGNPPEALMEALRGILEQCRRNERSACLIDVTAHAHVFGRPYGAGVFHDLISMVIDQEDIWTATREQVARHVLDVQPAHHG